MTAFHLFAKEASQVLYCSDTRLRIKQAN